MAGTTQLTEAQAARPSPCQKQLDQFRLPVQTQLRLETYLLKGKAI